MTVLSTTNASERVVSTLAGGTVIAFGSFAAR